MIFHKAIESVYQKTMCKRCDETGLVQYFTHKDFPVLTATPFCFASSLGHELKGNFYAYEGCDQNRLIVFDHGFGGGHTAYMTEIATLAKAGYKVFAYDHTGCMASGGEGARGLSQSLRDLDDCFKALKANPEVPTEDISVVGHSWGGFSTMNIAALHPDVKRVVVMAGFVSVPKMIEQQFAGPLKGYQKYILALEGKANPDYVHYSGIETLADFEGKALLIYDQDDPMVSKVAHYDALYSALGQKENISFILTEGKAHNPNYTKEAVAYLGQLTKALKKAKKYKTPAQKQEFRGGFDWRKMTEQDQDVWERILSFLA